MSKTAFVLFLLLTPYFINLFPVQAVKHRQDKEKVTVSATIDDTSITLYGYTSPFARVELSGINVFAVAYSDVKGYFEFDRTILPKLPGELCLTSVDDVNRKSFPVCIPPLPPTNYHTDVGPIILPPTLTVDSDTIKPNSTTVASGQSIPNLPIHIFLYQESDHAPIFPKVARAFELPVFSVSTDKDGHYSFNLPTAYSTSYRLYSTVLMEDNQSPKSNTLTYHLPSLFWLFWQQNIHLMFILPIFVLTLAAFIWILFLYLFPAPRRRWLPAIIPTFCPYFPKSKKHILKS